MLGDIVSQDGTRLKSPTERLERWRSYFDNLLNHDPPTNSPPLLNQLSVPVDPLLSLPPSEAEVEAMIFKLASGKAGGVDMIPAEALKHGGPALIRRITSLLELVWRTDEIPSAWRKAVIVPIFKKGDKSQCSNYRGISLLSVLGKVFTKILHNRIQTHREPVAREEQSGFRAGRSCSDDTFVLRQVLEERIRCGRRTIMVFIDFRSAFDCVHWPALWQSMELERTPPKLVRLVQRLYSESESCVRVNGAHSNYFSVRSGVRQGCTLSPYSSLLRSMTSCAEHSATIVEYNSVVTTSLPIWYLPMTVSSSPKMTPKPPPSWQIYLILPKPLDC